MYGIEKLDLMAMLKFEHRLIEQTVEGLSTRLVDQPQPGELVSITRHIDLLMTYGDHLHMEKEEQVVFREADGMDLPDSLIEMLADLRLEHQQYRLACDRLLYFNRLYAAGDLHARGDMAGVMGEIVPLLHHHFVQEETIFYPEILKLQKEVDQEEMLRRMQLFDADQVHASTSLAVEENGI